MEADMIETNATKTNFSTAQVNKKLIDNTFVPYKKVGQSMITEKSGRCSDSVSLGCEIQSTPTYNQSLVESKADGYNLLRGLVLNIFKTQGLDTKIATGDTEVDINTLSQADAQDLIADDGYFGVKKTSERIFDFAVSIAGNDPSKIDAVREGIKKGFQDAYDAFGGWLPDISYDTYDAVIAKLDDWTGGNNSPQQIS